MTKKFTHFIPLSPQVQRAPLKTESFRTGWFSDLENSRVAYRKAAFLMLEKFRQNKSLCWCFDGERASFFRGKKSKKILRWIYACILFMTYNQDITQEPCSLQLDIGEEELRLFCQHLPNSIGYTHRLNSTLSTWQTFLNSFKLQLTLRETKQFPVEIFVHTFEK